MRRLICGLMLGSGVLTSATAAPGFIVEPSGQATNHTCQSYALGVALAFKRDPAFNLLTAAELRKAELGIRQEIVKARGNAPEVTHEHIKAGFANYTGGRYRLVMEDVDIATMGQRISARTGVSSADIPPTFLLGATVKDVVLSSATRIENDSYGSGHIFTMLGVDGAPNSNQRVLVLNSAVKVKGQERNSCMDGVPDDPGPYTASLAWKPVSRITFKPFSPGKVRLWTVEKN
jgi:hypothetical protein